jgi:large subunit ribosomal protein L24
MKLRKDDNIIVIAGRDKGKTGKILSVQPLTQTAIVEGINISKRHTKPSDKHPRGGILDITKPINVSKIMVLDPQSGKPARVGYEIKSDGSKERIFKVSPNRKDSKPTKKKAETAEKSDKAGKK